MSDDEPFLTRWSRRKRDVAESQQPASGDAEGTPASPAAAKDHAAEPEVPAVDLSKLPSLESITAQTDIRGFLAPGVPAELTRAALRRAWSADTSIRDFIGLVENDWDVLAPAAAGGVLPLTVSDEMRRMVDAMFSPSTPADDAPESAQSVPAAGESSALVASEATVATAATGARARTPEADLDPGVVPPPAAPEHGGAARSEPVRAAEEIDAAAHNTPEESQSSGVIGRHPHGRALPK